MINDSIQANGEGLTGVTYVGAAGVPYTGEWSSVYALTPTVIATLISGLGLDGNPLMKNAADDTGLIASFVAPLSIAAGVVLRGKFTYIQLTSGSVALNNL